jgi:hypothetical protein
MFICIIIGIDMGLLRKTPILGNITNLNFCANLYEAITRMS